MFALWIFNYLIGVLSILASTTRIPVYEFNFPKIWAKWLMKHVTEIIEILSGCRGGKWHRQILRWTDRQIDRSRDRQTDRWRWGEDFFLAEGKLNSKSLVSQSSEGCRGKIFQDKKLKEEKNIIKEREL